MRIAAQETAPQIALRNCSREEGGWPVYVILVKGDCMLSSIYFPRRVLLVL